MVLKSLMYIFNILLKTTFMANKPGMIFFLYFENDDLMNKFVITMITIRFYNDFDDEEYKNFFLQDEKGRGSKNSSK